MLVCRRVRASVKSVNDTGVVQSPGLGNTSDSLSPAAIAEISLTKLRCECAVCVGHLVIGIVEPDKGIHTLRIKVIYE